MGLAPIANDSGRRSGRRPVRGGRKGTRSSLFLIALTVARYDPPGAFRQERER
ncbi:transposase [Mesorhizobium sp. M1027]|uniref:transposase n=1 Tax=Mesorhizobium sp. M1027 TaxID=2957050 RepID=UPI003337B3D1